MRFGQRQDKNRAQRLSDFVDSIMVRRRTESGEAKGQVSDGEFRELSKLAENLSAISLKPRKGFKERLHRDLSFGRALYPADPAARCWTVLRRLIPLLRPVMAAALVLAVWLGSSFGGSPAASAKEILTRSDMAVAGLLEPGRVLFRRWRIADSVQANRAAPPRHSERFTLEWIDGSDPRHATGKTLTSAGEMYLAYANELHEGRYRPLVYYKAGFSEPEALLSIVPGRDEFAMAAERFTGDERRIVDDYLSRGYLYEPMVSERRFNDAILRPMVGDTMMPREVISVDASGALDGEPVYKVRVVETVRLRFRWMQEGPPRMWLERAETVKYIAKNSFLTLRAEEIITAEDGRLQHTVRELVDTRMMEVYEKAPFRLEVPEGVAVRRQSAHEHLSQVVSTVRRAQEVPSHSGVTH